MFGGVAIDADGTGLYTTALDLVMQLI